MRADTHFPWDLCLRAYQVINVLIYYDSCVSINLESMPIPENIQYTSNGYPSCLAVLGLWPHLTDISPTLSRSPFLTEYGNVVG